MNPHLQHVPASGQRIDIGAPSPYTVRVSVSPIYECALDIAAFTYPEIHDKLERGLQALQDMRQRMSAALEREVQLAGQVHTWRSLLLLGHRWDEQEHTPWPEHVPRLCVWMEAREADLLHLAAPYLGEGDAPRLAAALNGDPAAQADLVARHQDNPLVGPHLSYLFRTPPKALREHLTALLTRWYDEMMPETRGSAGDGAAGRAAWMEALHREAERMRELAARNPAAAIVHLATRGLDVPPQPGIHTVWLVPQIAYRPFTIVNHLPGSTVYYYPLPEEQLPGHPADALLVRAATLYKALGDVQRLRLLRWLSTGPQSLAQLTDRLGATKSNVHHHLSLLRAAGLVRVAGGVYTLDEAALDQVGTALIAMLGGCGGDGV
ncbi:ArsR/SmtB family transcription factor [Alicyclobacillus macrosporangiidus]|uniref:ArsR/SmtB family transcription factor n=1 Tax=Alicyclobacillus macrosporangiidus TaxID=392015 RepID=UPI000496FDD1|nr:ArsR family transcriptional regulator [Alicyclobacillus macrosporangiidus]